MKKRKEIRVQLIEVDEYDNETILESETTIDAITDKQIERVIHQRKFNSSHPSGSIAKILLSNAIMDYLSHYK